MNRYLERVLEHANQCDSSGTLFTAQGLWQQTAVSTAIGVLKRSSLLLDEVRSNLNEMILKQIMNGENMWARSNMVEINNVCHHGEDIRVALQKLTRT